MPTGLNDNPTPMAGVREYSEQMEVELKRENERLVVTAFNEGGFKTTNVDLLDLLDWLSANRPDILEAACLRGN